MSVRREDAYQHILCIDLTHDRFDFSILNLKSKKIVQKETNVLSAFNRDEVAKVLTHELFTYEFANVVIGYAGERSTLIPVDLFSHSKPAAIFKLNFPEPIDNLDYNRIPELGVVNIYEMPLWIKSVFVIKFPRSKIIHRSTVLLKGIFDQPTFAPKIHVNIGEGYFYLILTKKTKLDYYNRFEFKEMADLVYYILFVLEQKEYKQSDFELHLYGVDENWEDRKWFQSFFECPLKIAVNPEGSSQFTQAKQLLCV